MWRLVLCLLAGPVWADSVIATRPIAAHAIITAEDVTTVAMDIPHAVGNLHDAIGQTANMAIPAGQAVRADQISALVQVARNAIVEVVLVAGGLEIRTEGRALDAGKAGEVIDIMNTTSRARIRGIIGDDGIVRIITPKQLE